MRIKSLPDKLGRLYNLARVFPLHRKERDEIAYWKFRLAAEGQLSNERYLYSYTSTFDIEPSFYAGNESWTSAAVRAAAWSGRHGR